MGIIFLSEAVLIFRNRTKLIMIKKLLVICLLTLTHNAVFSQTDYNKQFFNAKALFREGKYNLAMEGFKPLIPYDQNNQFSEYAAFYYALSAYKQGYKAVAKDMFNQIKSLHPKWDKMDEVNFWLGKIHFENNDYFQGLKTFSLVGDKKFESDIEAVKASKISGITDPETLKMMHEEYPKDELIVKALAGVLAKNITDENDKKQLESIIEKFHLNHADYFPEAPKSFLKDRYSVSVLLPFMVNTLEPTPGKKRNQIVLDFYEGVKLAVDTLNKRGVNISLRAYDTERNTEKVKKLLQTEELKNTDLIIGPFFPEENKVVQEFSAINKVNTVHPFTNNTETIGLNPYAFLFQPSSETLGRKSAEYMADHVRRKNCLIIYGTNKKDSVMMANFSEKAFEKGLNIVSAQKFSSKDAGKVLTLLATPTEFDEFKYPSQFTLKKDSIGSIYVATDEALIYTKVVSGIETRGDSIQVIGSENWIDDNAIDLEKYETLRIVLTAPNFAQVTKPYYQAFLSKFIQTHGRTPSTTARMGYEFMLFFGNQLKTNGVYFQDALSRQSFQPGFLSEGFNYQFGRDNQLVPFIAFKNGQITLIEKR
jgi:tetratricopeptide (TPR) repeat protein